jgi:hypothetical protein
MSREAAEALLAQAERGDKWPHEHERRNVLDWLNTWAAFRENDRQLLQRAANWNDGRRPYRIDALASRIVDAWAAYVAGEPPQVTPAAEADAENLAALLGEEGVGGVSELERGAGIASSEGEVWARITADELVAPRPGLDWISRRAIFPLWHGHRLAAGAVWTELTKPDRAPSGTFYRHLEVHAPGVVLNVLYEGKQDKLGRRVDLSAHPETEPLQEWWDHDLPGMLLVRIPNRLRGNRRLGVSDLAASYDYLLDLNEAVTIGSSNMRLTARKRAVISAAYVAARRTRDDLELTPEEVGSEGSLGRLPHATFDQAEEVFVEDPLDTEQGRNGHDPIRVMEYSFDAEPLIAWKRDIVESAVSRAGLVPQYIGTGTGMDGYAISGTALRLRFIPTDTIGKAKTRYWTTGLRRVLQLMAMLDAAPPARGELSGFGRPWTNPTEPPTIRAQPGIPVDEVEETQKHRDRKGAGIESTWQAVRELRPQWTDEQVDAEVERIKAEAPSGGPGMLGLA